MRRGIIITAVLAVVLVFSMPVVNTTLSIAQIPQQQEEPFSMAEEPETGAVEFTEHGSKTYLGDNRWRYRSSVGEENTWNGTHYLRYVYDLENKQVSIGKLTFTHGPNGVISVSHSGSGSMIGELKWYAQYYLSDQWNNFTFDNYEYLGATTTDENATIRQRWWSTNGELNVSYTYYYWNELKMRAKATNWAAQTVPVRVLWALTDIKVSSDYTLVYDNDVAVGVEIGNEQSIYWHDVTQSAPEININPILDKDNRRAAVVFGNMSSVLAQGETMDIDPTYTVAADEDDAYANYYSGFTLYPSATIAPVRLNTGGSQDYHSFVRIAIDIAAIDMIHSADFYAHWDNFWPAHVFRVWRVDGANWTTAPESLSARPTLDGVYHQKTGLNSGWDNINVTDHIINQIAEGGWVSGNLIGLELNRTTDAVGTQSFEDYQDAGSNHAYLTIDFTAFEGEYNYVDVVSDLHDPSDVGTHSDFQEMRDKDGSYDTLTEVDYGGTEYKYVDSISIGLWTGVGTTPYLDAQDEPTNYIWAGGNAEATGWSTFANTSRTGSGFTVTMSFYWYCDGDGYIDWDLDWTNDDVADASGSYPTQGTYGWSTTGTISGLDTADEINDCRLMLANNKGAGGPDNSYADAGRLNITRTHYDLDLEVGWVSADYDETSEELCIFGGTQGAEALRVDVWSGSWTNVFTDIAVGWNNVSVSSYLVDATFEIRFTDTDDDASVADTWQVEAVLLHTWSAGNNVPANDQAPTLDNPTESTKMFAQYIEYKVTVYVSDGDGFADIDYLELGFWDDTQTTEYWRFRYDEDTDTFTEEYDSGTVVSLNTGSSVATETGNDIDAQFWFTVDWDHADIAANGDAKCYVVDDEPEADTDWYEVTWTVETRLDYSVAPSVTSDDGGTVDRGDYDETFLLGGTLEYYGSSSVAPPSDKVDVWVSASEYGTNVGPWSDLTLASGAFEVTCYADDALGQDTYTVKPVIESAGSGGTSLYYTTDLTDTYIADIVQVQSYAISGGDDRIDTDATVTIDVTLWYDYDDSLVTDGTVTVNGLSASHQGSGVWRFTDTKSTVQLVTYDTVAVTGNTHGITTEDQNGQSETCIWDEVLVISYSIVGGDDRIDTSATVTIDVTLDYDYDDADVTDGTVTVNGQSAAHQGAGVWRFTDSEATVVMNTYDTVVCSGNTHGITVVNQNGQSETCIWDEVLVISYSVSDPRVNVNDNVDIDVTLDYDYDDTDVTDGTITINGASAAHQGSGVWRITDSEASVMQNTYDTVVAAGNTHGITVVNQNGQSTAVTWDRVQVQSYTVSDNHDNINDDVTIDVTLWYDYDDSLVTDGTVTINTIGAAHQGSGVWRITENEATVQQKTYDTVACSGNTHGITLVDQNGQSDSVIWDQIVVQTTVADDTRVDIDANSEIRVTLWLDYADEYLGTGDSVTLDGVAMTWDSGNSWFDLARTKSTVGSWDYFVNSSSEATYGITALDVNSQEIEVIFDRVQVQSYTVSDNHDNINDDVTIDVTLWYDYDDSLVTDGTVTINTIGAAHQGSGVWRITENEATVQQKTYDTVACSGNTHGITVVDQNGQSDSVIWDQIVVQTTVADDSRVDINANSEIRVTLWLDYADEYLGSGDTVTLDDTAMSWDAGNSWFDLSRTQASVDNWLYYVNSSSEATYGITALDVNSQEQEVIWDRIIILTTTTQDGRIDYDTQADIRVTAQLEYDSHALGTGDTLYMNDTSMSWVSTYFQLQPQFAEVGSWNFYVNASSANEATYGITVVNLDSNDVDQIWDRLVIDMQADDENPDNGIEVTFTLTIIFDYDDVTCTTYQIVVNRSTVWWHSFTNANKSLFKDTNSDVSYDYSTQEVTSESTYGILAFTSNTETVTWSPVGNNAPVNDTQPTCADLDDTDNLYAYLRTYTIVVYVSDLQGFADIDYLEISCYSDNQITLYWTVRYDEDTDTFSEQFDPSDYIYLDTGASSAVESGDDIDATFKIRINWNHPDITEIDFKAYVIDDEPESDTDWYENNWDFETRLDYSVAPNVSSDDAGTVDRGDLDETFHITGTIIYYGGSANPTTAIVDVWISGSEYGASAGPWSDLDLTSGAFDVTCYADDAVGQDTYTIKVVIEGAGSGGTDQYYTTSVTDTYIADKIQVQTTVADDTRLDISTASQIRVTLWLSYDATYLGSGDTVNLNDTAMSWDAGNSWFELSRSQSTVGLWLYYVNSSIESEHGITGLELNSKEVSVIWDSLTISLSNPSDQRIDISTSISGMVASATYDYDNTAYDGSFTLNNTQFSYNTAQKQGYKVDSADGDDTHGITAISSNPDDTYCIWDSLTAIISPPTDQRININANASGMVVSATYDYDSTAYDGTLSLNDENYAHSTVNNYTYYVSVGDGDDTHGITAVSSYNETWCVFDRLVVTIIADSTSVENGVQVNFTLTVLFDFGDSPCTTYEIAFTRGGEYWHTFTHANKSLFKDTNSGVSYVYTGSNVNDESTYDITAFTSNTQTVSWSVAGDGGAVGELSEPETRDPYLYLYIGTILFGLLIVSIVAYAKAPKGKSIYKDMKGVFR